jgi:hypothetical protein
MTGRYYGKDHTPNFYPSRGRGSLVETLPVGKGFDCMDDLEYFQKKVLTSLKIPPSYFLEDAVVVYYLKRPSEEVLAYDRAMKVVV